MKTANSVKPKRAKVEFVISAAMVAALGSLTTAETIDVSSIVTNVSGGDGGERAINEEFVVGDDLPILDYDNQIPARDLTIEILYTNGKEALGTDLLDIYTDLLYPLFNYTGGDLSMQIVYSLAGGATGDEQMTTSATETYIKNLPAPVGGAGTSGRVKFSPVFRTPEIVPSTIA